MLTNKDIDNLIMNLGQSQGVKTFLIIPSGYPWCSSQIPNYKGYKSLRIFQNDLDNSYKKTLLDVEEEIKIFISSSQR